MNAFLKKLHPADFIGLATITGGFYLLLRGIDTVVGGAVIIVVTYYFVKKTKNDHTKTD